MHRLMKVWSCSNCGMEIDIRDKEMNPGTHMVPFHACPDADSSTFLPWFAWTWDAQGLIREWCSEEELHALRKNPEQYIHTVLNPKLKRQKTKWTIRISMDAGHVLLSLHS